MTCRTGGPEDWIQFLKKNLLFGGRLGTLFWNYPLRQIYVWHHLIDKYKGNHIDREFSKKKGPIYFQSSCQQQEPTSWSYAERSMYLQLVVGIFFFINGILVLICTVRCSMPPWDSTQSHPILIPPWCYIRLKGCFSYRGILSTPCIVVIILKITLIIVNMDLISISVRSSKNQLSTPTPSSSSPT